jgi:TonB family protein
VPLPPLPPPLPVRFLLLLRLHSLFRWGVGLSIVVHLLIGIAIGMYTFARLDDVEAQDTIVADIVLTTPPPTPVPTEPPPPPPPPKQQLIPGKRVAPRLALPATAAAPRARPLRLNVLHTVAKASGDPAEGRYVPPSGGSRNGVPGGTGNAEVGIAGPGPSSNGNATQAVTEPTGEPATPSPAPPPTPSPTPSCPVRVVAARTVHAITPPYPDGVYVDGTVDVLVTLSSSGAVVSTSINRSSGTYALDAAALKAVRESTFAPAYVNCVAVGGTYLFISTFTYHP